MYGFISSPLLVKFVNAWRFWIGVVVIPWPNEAVANSVRYVKSIVPAASLGKVMPYMLIFYALILLGLMAVTYIPAVSIGLPMAMGIM